jgi:hypothetical protein
MSTLKIFAERWNSIGLGDANHHNAKQHSLAHQLVFLELPIPTQHFILVTFFGVCLHKQN